MGRIILTIPGPWGKPPPLESPFELDFGPRDEDLIDDLLAIGRRASCLGSEDQAAIRKHQGVVYAGAEFTGPGEHTWARHAAALVKAAFGAGACAALVEPGVKLVTPAALADVRVEHPHARFHLFVEVFGDAREILSEGMAAFDLPDVAVPYAGRAALSAAQVAAFALAAQMACDGLTPEEDADFRATESAPLYGLSRRAAPADDEDANPHGFWVLTLR